MPLRYTHRILEHLAHSGYRPGSSAQVARDMRVEPDEREAFEEAIRRLAGESKVVIDEAGVLRLPRFGEEVIGRFRLNARGFGFVQPETPYVEGDLFVPRGNVRDAISGDLVRAQVIRQSWRAKPRAGRSECIGRIVEVIDRGQDNFVGVLMQRGGNWFVAPDGRSLHDPVLIRDPHAKNAREGDKVVIELLHYPEEDYHAEGVITKVLGVAGEPDVETQAVITAHGLRTEFPDAAVDRARAAAGEFEQESRGPWPDREDLTETFIFTIDPPDAKDFDDAISIAYDESGGEWTLGIHIADVSHFVTPGSPLDEEGRERGNSVYLPRLVIPMLPEVLSNGVCSLQEDVPRFAKSAFINFDEKGRVLTQRFASTVIESSKRLTYLEAQALIDGDMNEARKHAATEPHYSEQLIETLRLSDRLARILRKRRHRDGMIVLNLPDVELVFDDDGHVVDAVPEDDAFTHTIIEMFMVEANEAVARCFEDLGVPIIRRIHPDPVHGDLAELQMYALAAHLSVPDQPTRFDLQRLLEATRDTPAGRALHFAVLRTLTKATYSPAMIGHFALASDHYAHFTSPIRRYPDLILHRALQAYLDATDNGRNIPGGRKRRELGKRVLDDNRTPDEAELVVLGKHCTDTENEAEEAERELRDFLVMQFLQEHHLGDEFPGVITGVTSGGVFVSIERFLVEGLVRGQDMPQSKGRPDRWDVNEASGRLTAQRSGASLGIGDIVTVKILQVDLASRHLDLTITQFPQRPPAPVDARATKRPGGKREKGKRKGYKQGRRGKRAR
ncbi:MAG: VacB/RNase II family 3'-5' exoribonuclease [Phycisphaerales bacterium]|nr:MAG: VacB/RNase II family 3'-5' exoribonuclease [Phycisphaerales bacterium]